MVNKALYIGAGIDKIPFKFCDWITKFYCVDSQPYSEFGTLLSDTICENGHNGFSRPNFIKELEDEYLTNNFILTGDKTNDIKFYTNCRDQIICYYTNTAIPDHHFKLREVCKEINALIVAGHDPDSILLNYVTHRLDYIGIEGTYYGDQEADNHNGIIARLHREEINHYFKSFIYFHNDGRKLTFSLWEDFMNYYYTLN
jgi:hypothetical protein